MGKTIKNIKHSDTLTMSECTDGFWLWDETREMNLAIRAASSDHAFVEALTYYQDRLAIVEKQYADLSARVDAFVSQFMENDND